MTNTVQTAADDVIAAALELACGGRWRLAADLLDGVSTDDAPVRARVALAAAQVALESDWFGDTALGARRLAAAEEAFARVDVDRGTRWDLAFAGLRQEYASLVLVDGGFSPGPRGKDPDALVALRRHAEELCAAAPDDVRRGWARMYLGLILDNVLEERDAAPAHYLAALAAGERGDDLLAREALRHLGDHDRERGDHGRAAERWARATGLGARAGLVVGTLSQQLLLAMLARDAGDEAGATVLATEIARWAGALGATRITSQATAFLSGADPMGPPDQA
jgi:hypothetical protein